MHQFGGQVYLDGANMNARLASPRRALLARTFRTSTCKNFLHSARRWWSGYGTDRCEAHLAPFVPGHSVVQIEGMLTVRAQFLRHRSVAPLSCQSADVHPHDGRRRAEKSKPGGNPNANYIASRLQDAFPVLYTGRTVAWRTNVFSIFAR